MSVPTVSHIASKAAACLLPNSAHAERVILQACMDAIALTHPMSTPQEQLRQAVEQSVATAIKELTLRWDSDEQQCYDTIMQAIAPFVDGKDGARLTWLENHLCYAMVSDDGSHAMHNLHNQGNGWDNGKLRAALDAAMAGRDGK